MSIIYLLSVLSIICMLLFLPKSKNRQEIIIWLPVCYIMYECLITFIASIFTILHVPANLISLGLMNIAISIAGLIWIKKTGNIQKYYFKLENLIFFLLLAVIVIFIGYEIYGKDFQICFETSDPASHLKIAMDTVNSQSVITTMSTMFLTPFTNGIFIRIFSPIFSGTDSYKSFIIKELINFGLSGAVFYSYVYKHLGTFSAKLFGMVITLFYIFGYPYNNLLFGFSYLGFSVTVITCLIFIADIFLESEEKNKIIFCFMSLGCFGVAECYTVFAPFVYIGIFICVAYKVKKETGCLVTSKHFYIDELKVFLLPTLLTIWFVIIYPRFIGSELLIGNDYGLVLTFEGYTYRNLYSDFLVFLPFALYGICRQKKGKRFLSNSFTFFTLFAYIVISFIGMYYGVISSYYYYKLNYVVWMLLLSLFIEGICSIYSHAKELVFIYCGCWGIIFLLWFAQWDMKLYEKNVVFNPLPNANSCYEIYNFNRAIRKQKTTVSPGLVQLCREVDINYKKEDQTIMYLGNWLDNYWYEALTNQRQSAYCTYDPIGFTQNFINGTYGDYLVVAKDDASLESCYSLIQDYEVVYENDYGIIIKRE